MASCGGRATVHHDGESIAAEACGLLVNLGQQQGNREQEVGPGFKTSSAAPRDVLLLAWTHTEAPWSFPTALMLRHMNLWEQHFILKQLLQWILGVSEKGSSVLDPAC